jgi:hypothetical protein
MTGDVLAGEPRVAGGNDIRCAGRVNPQQVVVMIGGVLGGEPPLCGGNDGRCAGRGTPAPNHYLGYVACMIDE